jgi:hypothetical protein
MAQHAAYFLIKIMARFGAISVSIDFHDILAIFSPAKK